MTLLRLQAAQARLYLDPAAREALRRGDRALAAEFSLDREEFDQLRRLLEDYADGVEIFAGMLIRKRDERLSQFYPILKRYLGVEPWQAAFEGYLRLRPTPPSSVAADAVAFGHHLDERLATLADGGIAADLVIFERTKAEVAADSPRSGPASASGGRRPTKIRPVLVLPARIRTLRHSPTQLIDRVIHGDTAPMKRPENGVTVVTFRGVGSLGVRTIEVGAWLGAILRKADGHATLDELVSELRLPDDRRVIDQLLDLLATLSEMGMIALNPEDSDQ